MMQSWGTQNQYIIFPILELIKKELGKVNYAPVSTNYSIIAPESNEFLTNSTAYQKAQQYSDIMNYLNSENYELELKREDAQFPKRLTRAIITFDETTAIYISLLRGANSKLTGVTVDFVGKVFNEPTLNNPYDMPPDIYIEYVKNGLYWHFYNRIVNSLQVATYNDLSTVQNPYNGLYIYVTDSSSWYQYRNGSWSLDVNGGGDYEQRRLDASQRMTALNIRNTYLRDYYHVEALPKEELFKYLPNPYAMDAEEYRQYVFCFWVWAAEAQNHPSITEQVKTQYSQKAQALRLKYGIEVEGLTFEEMRQYTSNPLCILDSDLIELYNLKRTIVEKLEASNGVSTPEIEALHTQKYQIYDKYYLIHPPLFTDVNNPANGDYWTWELLEPFLPNSESKYEVKTILRINISLNYDQGMLKGVTSKIVEGV